MFSKNREGNQQLDRAGAVVLRAAVADAKDIEAAADAPFLLTRIRARISDERRRRGGAGGWQSLPLIAWRAVPAMALVALLAAVVMIWTAQQPTTPATGFGIYEEALSDTSDPGVEQTILSRNNLSHDEIFSIVVDRNEGRNGR